MASNVKITGCTLETNSIVLSFSDALDLGTTGNGALNPENFTVYDPGVGLTGHTSLADLAGISGTPSNNGKTIQWTFTGSGFRPGDYVLVTVTEVADGSGGIIDSEDVSAQVPDPGPGRITRDVEDAITYPILTEEIGYRPSPVGMPSGGARGTSGGAPSSNLGMLAASTVSDVLGWKSNTADPKGFIGALTQSFNLTEFEGHVSSQWVPRTYAVQTDLGGGITGAQASLYTRAKEALDSSLPLLDGLYPLDPEADPEYVKALREMARSQMTEIVKELGTVGLPSILRINTYFDILVGQHDATVVFDPDQIKGTLGDLRDVYGIYFSGNQFSNSVEDEQDLTNFRVVSDYMTSLLQSWIANRKFFIVKPGNEAFFGTQLVLISRQFNVIAETVDEVRFALDSVFIGPAERQSLLLEFGGATAPPPMYLEDMLEEFVNFTTEGPRLLRDGGRISVSNNILPIANSLLNLVDASHAPANIADLPDGFRTARVQKSLDDLEDQLIALINLVGQVKQNIPTSEDRLAITGIANLSADGFVSMSLIGRNFDVSTAVTINSSVAVIVAPIDISFLSSEVIEISFDPTPLEDGPHDITVTKRDGQSATLTEAFTLDSGNITSTAIAAKHRPPRAQHKRPTRKFSVTVNDTTLPALPKAAQSRGAGQSMIARLHKLDHEQDHLFKIVKEHSSVLRQIAGSLQSIQESLDGQKAKKK